MLPLNRFKLPRINHSFATQVGNRARGGYASNLQAFSHGVSGHLRDG
jgi:hypothetical protein